MTVNQFRYCYCLTEANLTPATRSALAQRRGGFLKNARWQAGDRITVRFLGGSTALRQRVQDVANQWTQLANLTLDFVPDGESDIRIAFEQGNGSWSYIGTMCRSIAEPEPTMNFGWLTDGSTDDEVQSVTLHEFGHAIGMIHEHQTPDHAIQWNRAAVTADLSGPPNNWDDQTIETNMFQHYASSEIIGTPIDATSIMMYPIPKSWTLDDFSAGFNETLSDQDKALARGVYPGRR